MSRFYLTLWLLLGFLPSAASNEVLVSHKQVGESTLELRNVRAIFTLRQHAWKNGTSIQVFVMRSDHPLHKRFCMRVLRVFPNKLQAVWDRVVFTGGGKAPIQVNNEAEMLQRVANTPGAIGYIAEKGDSDAVQIISLL